MRSNSSVVPSSSAPAVIKKRVPSAGDVPTVSTSEPNLLPTDNKSTKSSGKHKTRRQSNENSNNSNSADHNLRRSILSVSDTSLNKIPHKQSHAAKPAISKSESKEHVRKTSPEQVNMHDAGILVFPNCAPDSCFRDYYIHKLTLLSFYFENLFAFEYVCIKSVQPIALLFTGL